MKHPRVFQRGLVSLPEGGRLHLGGCCRDVTDLGKGQVAVINQARVVPRFFLDPLANHEADLGLGVYVAFLGSTESNVVDLGAFDLPARLVLDGVDCCRALSHCVPYPLDSEGMTSRL